MEPNNDQSHANSAPNIIATTAGQRREDIQPPSIGIKTSNVNAQNQKKRAYSIPVDSATCFQSDGTPFDINQFNNLNVNDTMPLLPHLFGQNHHRSAALASAPTSARFQIAMDLLDDFTENHGGRLPSLRAVMKMLKVGFPRAHCILDTYVVHIRDARRSQYVAIRESLRKE
eukprot:509750_1